MLPSFCGEAQPPPSPGMYGVAMSAPLKGLSAGDLPSTLEVRGLIDQGLAQEWNFNQHESLRNFRRAVELEPECALCWWALARAYGPNTNRGVFDQAMLNGATTRASDLALSSQPSGLPSKLQVLIQTAQALVIPPGANSTVAAAARNAHASVTCSAADKWADDYTSGRRWTARDDDLDALCADATMTTSPWDYYGTALMSQGERVGGARG